MHTAAWSPFILTLMLIHRLLLLHQLLANQHPPSHGVYSAFRHVPAPYRHLYSPLPDAATHACPLTPLTHRELATQLRRDVKPQLDEMGVKLFFVSIGTWDRSQEFSEVRLPLNDCPHCTLYVTAARMPAGAAVSARG